MEYIYVLKCIILEENPEIKIPVILGGRQGFGKGSAARSCRVWHELRQGRRKTTLLVWDPLVKI